MPARDDYEELEGALDPHRSEERRAVVQETIARFDARQRERALDRLRHLLIARRRDDGVWFASQAWIVAARRS